MLITAQVTYLCYLINNKIIIKKKKYIYSYKTVSTDYVPSRYSFKVKVFNI